MVLSLSRQPALCKKSSSEQDIRSNPVSGVPWGFYPKFLSYASALASIVREPSAKYTLSSKD